VESLAHTAKQIEQYRTQLQQYENQLINSRDPKELIWDQAQQTIEQLIEATDTLEYHENQLGSLQDYLDKYQDATHYRDSPCYSPDGCSEAEWKALGEQRAFASTSQKRANDAAIRSLRQQRDNLEADAEQLERLQAEAGDAEGQLAAIGYGNQLASHQSNQLLQMRSMMMAQYTTIATKMQADADREARQQVAEENFGRGNFVKSEEKSWTINAVKKK
jgi:P-type conjugative transfer protein TrbJ